MGGPSDRMAPYDTAPVNDAPTTVHKRTSRETHTNGSTNSSNNGGITADKTGKPKSEEPHHEHNTKDGGGSSHPTSWWTWIAYVFLLLVSKYTLPSDLNPRPPTLQHVWYYGWVTALSTGLGAAPLLLTHDMGKQMLSVGNAVAAGMMLSASYSLVTEGAMVEEEETVGGGHRLLSAPTRVLVGVVAGLIFILSTKKILDKYEDLKLGELHGMDAKKVLLIVFVMTLHSFSEGVGIGVSFGGANGAHLGFLISATLAVHNVPEGLAVALVLNPRGVSKLNTGLWCVFTSLPQPLMAVPAYLFVGQFMPFLPVGLGFAAGAMFWVACFELFMDAVQDSSRTAAVITTSASFVTMLCVHSYLDALDDGLEEAKS